VRRSYKFLLRPAAKQQVALAGMVEDHRQLYNAALEHRKTAFQRAGVTVRYGEQSADLKHTRQGQHGGQGRWSFCSQQATLRRLDKAFAAFFRRVKAGQKPGYPRFKGGAGSTRWNGPGMAMGAAGIVPRAAGRPGSGCRASGRSRCTSTAW
jgi:putative transposase